MSRRDYIPGKDADFKTRDKAPVAKDYPWMKVLTHLIRHIIIEFGGSETSRAKPEGQLGMELLPRLKRCPVGHFPAYQNRIRYRFTFGYSNFRERSRKEDLVRRKMGQYQGVKRVPGHRFISQ
jgi:hypothetical protein